MCGLTGFWRRGRRLQPDDRATATAMGQRIAHRGPDDAGIWADDAAGVALAHVRLSIVDVSPAGHQPMVSPSGRYVTVFNGEIYNHAQLRRRLPQERWRGNSDTETLLACIDHRGVEAALRDSIGMFALALWDRAERVLWLARDRLGEKPLYYGWQNGVFLFGSELKALKAHPDFTPNVDRDALALFLKHCYVPAPYSIYRGILKLRPGMLLKLNEHGPEETVAYWSMDEAVAAGRADPFTGTETEAVALLDGTIADAVSLQRVADVPLGAFLSGGVDSSTVVALMQAQSKRPIKTFTIGLREHGYNEAEHAKAVARHLGTDHTELYVTPDEARAVIPLLPDLYDEPFGDSSQIPTHLVSRLARQQVTVSLSGDGGDELFGGYNRYFWGDRIWRKVAWMPQPLRRMSGRLITSVPVKAWNGSYSILGNAVPRGLRIARLGDKLHKLADRMSTVKDIDDLYCSLVSEWTHPTDVVIGAHETTTLLSDRTAWPSGLAPEHRMMYLDTMTYLPDDILAKVDRAAMGVSLESRVPFLDHRVVELAWRLPLSMKIRNGQGKWILREVLYRYVPRELIERPKMGFGIPLGAWLRGPLRDWAEGLLQESRLVGEGFLRPSPIRQKWAEHLSGERDWQQPLWNVLMFQAWLGNQR
jgi:asparagine synthase (glutamine-hydrolysing)